jgi:hypothetical protein
MSGTLVRAALSVVALAMIAAVLATSGYSRSAATPFYIVPSLTQECHNVGYCKGIAGPWVFVPARGEATYLFSCPPRPKQFGKYLVGGTDARASSKHVRVWFDGQLGAPVGVPANVKSIGAPLLFHAVTDNGKPGTFQPILGCVSLVQATKRSTVSARIATVAPVRSAPAPDLQATHLVLEPGWDRSTITRCGKNQTLVGSWSAIAFGTSGPPDLPPVKLATISMTEVGNTVHATIRTNESVPHLFQIQIGAVCER